MDNKKELIQECLKYCCCIDYNDTRIICKISGDINQNDFLDMAIEIVEANEPLLDLKTCQLVKPKENQISMAKCIDLEKKEYIAVAIYKGTKEEIEAMHNG